MKKITKVKKVAKVIPVCYEEQVWKSFKTPPNDDGDAGYGPSGTDLWIYHPSTKWVSCWSNWSGCLSDITKLIDEKAMWCYCLEPIMPKVK